MDSMTYSYHTSNTSMTISLSYKSYKYDNFAAEIVIFDS